MLIKSKSMHIDTANKIAVSCKATSSTYPISILGFMFMPTYRTLATCSSFGASEAHDVSLFRFLGEIVEIFPVFPQSHTLIVVSTSLLVADPMGIANKELANLLFLAEGDDFSCGFVSHVPNTPLCSGDDFILGALQLLPSARVLLASGLLRSQLAQLFASLTLERPDASTRDNDGLSRVCADGCEVDFAKVYGCMNITRNFFSLWLFNTDMQFKAIVPNQATGTAVFRKLDWQDDGFASLPHGQDKTSVFTTHSLSGPFDRIEPLGTPGVFHFHVRMSLTKLTCRLDVGKKGMHHHLDRLAMQGKLSFGGLLQFSAPRPLAVSHSGLFVDLTTQVPHLSGFHLSSFQVSKQLWGGVQPIHAHGIHCCLLPFLISFDMLFHGGQNLSAKRAVMSFCNLFHLFQDRNRKADRERFRFFFFITHVSILQQNWMHAKREWALSSHSLKRGGTSRTLLLKKEFNL